MRFVYTHTYIFVSIHAYIYMYKAQKGMRAHAFVVIRVAICIYRKHARKNEVNIRCISMHA